MKLISKEIELGIWSIKVFHSPSIISDPPDSNHFQMPTIQAANVTDVHAEFIADPFIIENENTYFMFFEVFDKARGKGIISVAKSMNGEQWTYDKIVLKENYHLSYPYVFKHNGDFYMIPESSEASGVFLYKSKNFPYDWEKTSELLTGKYVDSSLFRYMDKWWMFSGENGKLHLFLSDHLESGWKEHPKSPIITDDFTITRPGGRVIEEGKRIYRYTQDGTPAYGSAVRAFEITLLSEKEYEEKEVNLILKGTEKELDWRKDGMHSIDQLKIDENKWLIAVDGHKLEYKNYLLWKLDSVVTKLAEIFRA
ncbi:hypothetical protein [Heyndrickxia acidicola]|uniref:Glucosamine inositolphosphorylceramide transferase 1 N-terminal domain-containing protein n=1 Tax=Heyndrickxia acidicola TaxID=209389 RepID=A0ABU6MKJ2_9BACI|nr:hypothetical protein [Heyndrickxia acidicola]MED1205211.1 hypothetical protein [Heyndrickxia acidicola]